MIPFADKNTLGLIHLLPFVHTEPLEIPLSRQLEEKEYFCL